MTRTTSELRDVVVQSLASIAPEIDPTLLDGSVPIREQVDLDSMDYLNFVIAVSTELGIDIPEVDYPKLMTLDSFVDYLTQTAAR
jgi:acyl carrier protein